MLIKKKQRRKTLYNSILNYITKCGDKALAIQLLNLALLKASKKTKLGCQLLLSIAFQKLSVSIEVKDVQRRGKFFKIPFPISLQRQRYLSIKWFFKAIELDTRPLKYSDKICFELISLLNSKKIKIAFI